MKILKINLKVNYLEVNKESDLHIAHGTYNPRKLPIKRSKYTKLHFTALVTQ
jgi:hypothetical protein